MKKTVGRKPIGERALTAAEKKQRQRAKQLCQIKAAENNGYNMIPVLLSNKQLASLLRFLTLNARKMGSKQKVSIDSRMINEAIFYAMKRHLKALEQHYIVDLGHPVEAVNACTYIDDNSIDYNNLMEIEAKAQELFEEWEKSQCNNS